MIEASAAFLQANASLAKAPIFALEIDGYPRVFTNAETGIVGHYPWIVSIDDHALTVDDLEGSSAIGDLNVTVLDLEQAITADLPDVTLEGSTVQLKHGFPGMDYEDFVVLFTGRITTVPMADSNNCYVITAQDKRVDLKRLIYLTGDDGEPTSSEHPKSIVGNPMDIALSILTDPSYLNLDEADIDRDFFEDYRDQVFAGLLMEFSLTTAPEAKDFLEKQIFKPLGGYLRVDANGRVTGRFFTPLPGTADPVLTIDRDNSVGIPEPLQSDLVNVLTVRFDKDDSDFLSESVQIDGQSESKYGQQGQQIIESDGLRAGFQGFSIAEQTAAAIFARYGFKNPKIENFELLWSACLLEPGDLVLLTHNLVPDRDLGVMGVEEKLFEVLNRTWKFTEGRVEVTLVDGAGRAVGGRFRIAPDDVPAFTLATTEQKARYMFISNASGEYSDTTEGHKLS